MTLQPTEHTRIDDARYARTGIPEVVYAQSKTLEQIEAAMRALWDAQQFALATRVPAEMLPVLAARLPEAALAERPRALRCGRLPRTGRSIGLICAGTSDLPVAEEAAFVADAFGHDVVQLADVGVAGVHRLLDNLTRFDECCAIVVVAGMEGALPSIVAGLVRQPVIGVPTSIGYGVATGGIAAMHAMLASCAPGIAVVNVDNGFGAACVAHKVALATQQ
ncbi:MAG: nickel pincer cofactor biosynthesis protein LarB [Vulcanimicrobiaceae bacterium]